MGRSGRALHEPSVYHVLTGQIDSTLVVPRNQRTRRHYPGPGAVVAHFSTCASAPASVTIPRPVMHDGVKYAGTDAEKESAKAALREMLAVKRRFAEALYLHCAAAGA